MKKRIKNLKYIKFILPFFSFLFTPLIFFLLAWWVIIVIIAIIIAIFSNFWIPFYYNISHTIYDIPVNTVKISLNSNNFSKNQIQKELNNPKNYYKIIWDNLNKQYINNYSLVNWISKFESPWKLALKKLSEQWQFLTENINYVSNLKFYSSLWKNYFLKNLELPLWLLSNLKVKIVDKKVIYLWNNPISFYYNLENANFINSPLFISLWNKISQFYKKYDKYKCNDKIENDCYNKLPKIDLYTNINYKDNKWINKTLYVDNKIAIKWFWLKLKKIWNWQKQIIFYLKIYKTAQDNLINNLKKYLKNNKRFWDKIYNKNDFWNIKAEKLFNTVLSWSSSQKFVINSPLTYNINNPYIILNNDKNELRLNFQIQLLSLSSFLWNIRNSDWSKKLIYDVNLSNNQVTWTDYKPQNKIIEKSFNNNDYNNDNIIIKDKYKYLNKKYLNEKYIQTLIKYYWENYKWKAPEWLDKIYKKLAFIYYYYYVYTKYKDYLSNNDINLYWIQLNNNNYLWDNFIKYIQPKITKQNILNDFCNQIYIQLENWGYYNYNNLFLKKWQLENWKLKELFNTIKKTYCDTKNMKNNLKKLKEKDYKNYSIFNNKTYNLWLLEGLNFNKKEIQMILSNFWLLENQKINWKAIIKLWYNLEYYSFMLKFIMYSEKNNIKYKPEIDKIIKEISQQKLNWNIWKTSNYVDFWFSYSKFSKLFHSFFQNIDVSYYKNYLNSMYSYIWYYQIQNDLRKILSWKRNALEYLMYYKNTRPTMFKVMDFTVIKKILSSKSNNNLTENNIKINIDDYPYIVWTIIKNFYNKQWFTFQFNEKNSLDTWNFISFSNWKIISYNYCDSMKTKFNDKDYNKCIKFSKWALAFLILKKQQQFNKLNNYSYNFYNTWFKKFRMFNWFWNKSWLFPFWKQATLNPKISNWTYPWQCVHYIVINVNKKKLYGWNAENWCKVAEWKKDFQVITNLQTAKQEIAPWDIIVFNHYINWRNNWIWHIAMVSNIKRKLDWKLSKVDIQEFNAWCWNSLLWSSYIQNLFNSNWLDSSKYYLHWCIFYYNIKKISSNTLTRWQWWNNIMPMKCIIKIKNPKDYNNLSTILWQK